MKNKKIVITGGTAGLGLALARKLSALGAQAIILARDEERGRCIAAELGCDFQFCNVADSQSCYEAYEAIVKKYGDIDILINNAGIWLDNGHGEDDPGERTHVFDTNVLGAIDLIGRFLPVMREKNSGTIVNINSIAALPAADPSVNWKTYAASKAALARYSDALREELRETKVKVIQIFPGGFGSDMYMSAKWDKDRAFNQPWMMSSDDVADCLIFMLTRPGNIMISSMTVENK